MTIPMIVQGPCHICYMLTTMYKDNRPRRSSTSTSNTCSAWIELNNQFGALESPIHPPAVSLLSEHEVRVHHERKIDLVRDP